MVYELSSGGESRALSTNKALFETVHLRASTISFEHANSGIRNVAEPDLLTRLFYELNQEFNCIPYIEIFNRENSTCLRMVDCETVGHTLTSSY